MGTRGRHFIAVRRAGKKAVVKFSAWRRHDAYPVGLGREVRDALEEVSKRMDAGELSLDTDEKVDQVVAELAHTLCHRSQEVSEDTSPEDEFVGYDAEELILESQKDVFCEHVYGVILHPASGAMTLRYSNRRLEEGLDDTNEGWDIELDRSDLGWFVTNDDFITPPRKQHLYPPGGKRPPTQKRKADKPPPAAKKKRPR